MNVTEANKSFVAQMLGEKKRLEDFPDRVDPNIVTHEPASLPFGGTYRGLAAFQRYYPVVRRYYDFESFRLLGVYADGDTVFATIRVRVADSDSLMFLAEQFTFSGTTLTEVRVHACEAPLESQD
ncbi:MAG TPA: nuclear transport factor 2 family protein [Gemmatimonadaceae bacterium]|nr:nuclear transport factor 2 family protein [Gemmatimonadaceae bacterium]